MVKSRSLVDKLRGIQSDCRYERKGALNTFHCYNVTGDYFDRCVEQAEQLEQRYQQLAGVARDLYKAVEPMHESCSEDTCLDLIDKGWPSDACLYDFRNQLEELGVEL